MAMWLFKEEPEHYSFADLERDRKTLWGGVSNALARKHLRSVQKGDRIWFYHTGSEKAIVGEMRAKSGPQPDPTAEDENGVAVEVEPVRRLLSPVSLQTIKEDSSLAGWDLVRLPRLSVMPVTEEQWQRIEELSRAGASAGARPRKRR
jgi:predicted RNA-binding protein with PUA-like domain